MLVTLKQSTVSNYSIFNSDFIISCYSNIILQLFILKC